MHKTPVVDDPDNSAAAPWYLRLGAWIGIGTGPGALMAGAGMASVGGPRATEVGIVVGAALLTSLAVANGRRGQAWRAPTVDLARRVLGAQVGPWVVAVLVTLGVSGWSGVYFGVAGSAAAGLLGQPVWMVCLPFGAVLWVVYRSGFERWNLLVAVTGTASVAVAVLSYVTIAPAGGGAPATPAGGPAGQVLLITGLVVSFAAVFALRSPDFTWDARRPGDVVRAGVVLWTTMIVFLMLGAGIYRKLGEWDLGQLVTRSSVPALGVALLALSATAPIVSGLHSGALSLSQAGRWQVRRGALLVLGAAMALGTTGFHTRLLGFMSVIGAVLAPVIPVLLLAGARYRVRHGWGAWIAGSGTSLLLIASDLPVHVVAGVLVSGACVLLGAAADPAPGAATDPPSEAATDPLSEGTTEPPAATPDGPSADPGGDRARRA